MQARSTSIATARRALSAAMGELEAAVAAARSAPAPAGDDPGLVEAQATARAALDRVGDLESRLAEVSSARDAAAAAEARAAAARDAAEAARDDMAGEIDALKAEIEALRLARAEDAAMIEEALAELRDVV